LGAQSANSIRFAPKGNIYMAPIGTAAPDDVTTVLPAAWKDLGYADNSGVQLTPSIETQPIEVWQSAVPAKFLVTSAALQIQFVMQQFDKDSVELYFGAAFVETEVDSGVFKLDLSSAPDMLETSLLVHWEDATTKNRLYIPRATVSTRDALSLVRTDNQKLGVTLDALDSGGIFASILTNADMGTTP
jgi:hypothetical protein